jgi:hypothetical protein
VPLVFPDEDLVVVANAWNVLPGKALGARVIMERVLGAITAK